MSDNFVDPILAEDFDPNGPPPTVDYSKMKFMDINTREIFKIKNGKEILLTEEEAAEKETQEVEEAAQAAASEEADDQDN